MGADMAWNDMTREQMEAQLLRQAQTIGRMREALTTIQTLAVASGAALTFATMNSAHTQIDKITRAALKDH